MSAALQNLLAWLVDKALGLLVTLLTGVRTAAEQELPFSPLRKVYYANHSSHGDFVLVWNSLPSRFRRHVRPVAGADYWLRAPLRRFVIRRVFNGLLIPRDSDDPQAVTRSMGQALQAGSLILFPEGTRNTRDDVTLLPFKSGIYHLARENPDVQFVPLWIDNISRVLPKGKWLPVPLLCAVIVGQPLQLTPGEDKDAFLARARRALLQLAPSQPEAA